MALLDVTDVLFDPDFVDYGLVCERSAVKVGEDGIARTVTERIDFCAVVTPDSGDILERLEEGERIKGRITVHSHFELRDGAEGGTADIIEWRGKRYTVSNVSTLVNFGRGFVCASCDVIPYTG